MGAALPMSDDVREIERVKEAEICADKPAIGLAPKSETSG
jgi:hypothetical protein